MRRWWLAIGGLLLGGSLQTAAWAAAAAEASKEADTWADVKADTETRRQEEREKKDVAESPGPPAEAGRRKDLNEMKGILHQLGTDPNTFRITVNGGFNVEFAYDRNTVMLNGGKSVTPSDLSYGDAVVVRYSGKELYAVEVERVGRAPRP
jgi:hypothetical protein